MSMEFILLIITKMRKKLKLSYFQLLLHVHVHVVFIMLINDKMQIDGIITFMSMINHVQLS